MHSESACKLIKSLLSLLTQWTWSSSTDCALVLTSVHCDKQRLWDHLMFRICSHMLAHPHTHWGSNASTWQRFEGSYRCKYMPCNCTSSSSALSRLDAVVSTADSICFSSGLFFVFVFFLPKTWFPYLPKALESSHLSFSASPSSSCSTNLYLFWSKQDWCKLQQRGRCHSQTAKWWRGSLLCSFTYFLHFSSLIFGKFPPSQPCFYHTWHVQILSFSLWGIQEKEGRIAGLSFLPFPDFPLAALSVLFWTPTPHYFQQPVRCVSIWAYGDLKHSS